MAVQIIIIIAIGLAQVKEIARQNKENKECGEEKTVAKEIKKAILVILGDFQVKAVAKVKSLFVNCSYRYIAPVKTVQNRGQLYTFSMQCFCLHFRC